MNPRRLFLSIAMAAGLCFALCGTPTPATALPNVNLTLAPAALERPILQVSHGALSALGAGTRYLLSVQDQPAPPSDPQPSQQPSQPSQPRDVEVTVTTKTEQWYLNPVWIAIGVLALLVIVVLVALAARSSGSATTVVHE